MLFNSLVFIFIFLPITYSVFFLISRRSHPFAAAWLTLASLVFYGWWNPEFVLLLAASIVFNYTVGLRLQQTKRNSLKKVILTIGVSGDIILLCYYKYADFFITNVNSALDLNWTFFNVVLPLGISFFTFTQIAFLVDAYRGEAKEYNFIYYCLFVTYFPHLIAGPILHHKEMMPQFNRPETYHFSRVNFAAGLALFGIGLFKKVVLADSMIPFVLQAFDPNGGDVHFISAWSGALAYTLQIYFDFSAYTDMALGISKMIGVKLPINFNSPYKSRSIIEFWCRWHMTLSRFLRDYLYIPLGGNRNGAGRRYVNLFVTMVIGGLWHGAGWTFLLWGALHGVYLAINNFWITVKQHLGLSDGGLFGSFLAYAVTFLAVVVSWVLFRAENLDVATAVLSGMMGANGFALHKSLYAALGPFGPWLSGQGVEFIYTDHPTTLFRQAVKIFGGLLLVWMAPNSQQILGLYEPGLEGRHKDYVKVRPFFFWHPNALWAIVITVLFATALPLLGSESEFLYFQF